VVLETVNTPDFLAGIFRKGERIRTVIQNWNHPRIGAIRSRGLMIGVDIDAEAWPVLEAALEEGLLLLSAGPKTLRFLPPYTISDGEIDLGLEILRRVLDRF
jgi:acetylornithine/succinyldiaminopimelate/putrescine aminotransferase